MTFSDIFKSKFIENIASIPIFDMVLAMALAFGMGCFIFLIYQKTYKGVLYSASFGITLVAMTSITTLIILAVTSNVVLSLGMVGALSIVRFRTAIKEPMDIAFLFWSIAVGIVLAAGMIPLAVFGSVLIGLILLSFTKWKPHDSPYIVVIRCDDAAAEAQALTGLRGNVLKYVVKSKTVAAGSIELHYEVRLKSEDTSFVNTLSGLPGVRDVVLVSYNGDYMA
jgi:uncharacterized membrane protein YhiD involved in acid resistance